MDRRSFMKMLGVGCVTGPGMLAGGAVGSAVGLGAKMSLPKLVRSIKPDEFDSTVMAIRVAMAEKLALPGPVMAQPNMTANEVEDIMKAAYGTIYWNPKSVKLKEI